jgi:hypothetical protein
MEPQMSNQDQMPRSGGAWYSPLCRASTFSRVAIAIVVIALPFLGGYVGFRISASFSPAATEVVKLPIVPEDSSVQQNQVSPDFSAFLQLEMKSTMRDGCDESFFQYKYTELKQNPLKLHAYSLIKNANPGLDCLYFVTNLKLLTDEILVARGGYFDIGAPYAFRGWRINVVRNEVESIDSIFPNDEVYPVESFDSRYLIIASSTNARLDSVNQFFVYDIVTDTVVLEYTSPEDEVIGGALGAMGSADYRVMAKWLTANTFEVSHYDEPVNLMTKIPDPLYVKTFALPDVSVDPR